MARSISACGGWLCQTLLLLSACHAFCLVRSMPMDRQDMFQPYVPTAEIEQESPAAHQPAAYQPASQPMVWLPSMTQSMPINEPAISSGQLRTPWIKESPPAHQPPAYQPASQPGFSSTSMGYFGSDAQPIQGVPFDQGSFGSQHGHWGPMSSTVESFGATAQAPFVGHQQLNPYLSQRIPDAPSGMGHAKTLHRLIFENLEVVAAYKSDHMAWAPLFGEVVRHTWIIPSPIAFKIIGPLYENGHHKTVDATLAGKPDSYMSSLRFLWEHRHSSDFKSMLLNAVPSSAEIPIEPVFILPEDHGFGSDDFQTELVRFLTDTVREAIPSSTQFHRFATFIALAVRRLQKSQVFLELGGAPDGFWSYMENIRPEQLAARPEIDNLYLPEDTLWHRADVTTRREANSAVILQQTVRVLEQIWYGKPAQDKSSDFANYIKNELAPMGQSVRLYNVVIDAVASGTFKTRALADPRSTAELLNAQMRIPTQVAAGGLFSPAQPLHFTNNAMAVQNVGGPLNPSEAMPRPPPRAPHILPNGDIFGFRRHSAIKGAAVQPGAVAARLISR
ncbi:hypothetical protein CXG81DRAFT_18540 [Caulochytrium protostelioides]|uniref:Uncharacterized protein n=1 Tax=Caulochytrium protostelioides TaxID=1555241 RepID=A0A4P9X8X8_9FUNG|nr:hypothetical protein CXG81DRAFT_18540 [Caulochytrium protostelioides]|eukprot:RKP01722.1 hypothetical protein CXG81DRAFT_18540 [Caulochytrium protostelioides]